MIFDLLKNYGCTVEPCGSRVTCSPAPTDTDADYLVELPWSLWGHAGLKNTIKEAGFHKDGNDYTESSEFESWRNGKINLIITADKAFAARHRSATHICQKLNLLDKADRVMVFQAVLYGNKV
jgi:hypothetical protein